MAAQRCVLVVLGAQLLIACLAIEGANETHSADISPQQTDVNPKIPGLAIIKEEIYDIATTENFQWAIAILALPCAVVALWDGKRFFQVLVSISMGVISFTFIVSQLKATWTGPTAENAKYVAALEVGVFIGVAAYWGWEGTQLLLGLLLGLYLYHGLQVFALNTPGVQAIATHSVWHVCAGTLMVALATSMLHNRLYGGKVLGIICPIVGGSLIVAICGYLFMLALTVPACSRAIQVDTPTDVPAVLDFWLMILCPTSSKAVGFFTYTKKSIRISETEINLDRTISMLFWFIVSSIGIYVQLKAENNQRAKVRHVGTAHRDNTHRNDLEEPLVDNVEERREAS